MSSVQRAVLGITLACAFSVGCVDSSNQPNDNTAGGKAAASSDAGAGKATVKDAKVATGSTTGSSTTGSSTTGSSTTGDDTTGDETTGSSTTGTSTTGTSTTGTSTTGTSTTGTSTTGTSTTGSSTTGTSDDDAGTGGMTTPVVKVVGGSATKNMCLSYTKPMGDKCGGYFCGVTQDQIAAEMPADTLCGASAAEGACNNKLPTLLASCARDIKSGSPLASNDELKPMIQACVFKDADIKAKTPQPCMDCFLTAATCAGDKCLVECLTGDSKECDACRATNKCDTTVFTCANVVSPF